MARARYRQRHMLHVISRRKVCHVLLIWHSLLLLSDRDGLGHRVGVDVSVRRNRTMGKEVMQMTIIMRSRRHRVV